jgi:hypothetical protein
MMTTATQAKYAAPPHVTLTDKSRAAVGVALALCSFLPQVVLSQSAQRYSVQVSAALSTIQPDARAIPGAGIESQFRFNRIYSTEDFGAISLGVGAQGTVHSSGREQYQIIGVFLEPRWALPFSAGCAHPYLASRIGAMHVKADFSSLANDASNGFIFGAGAGIAFRVTRTMNLDVGAQLIRQQISPISGVNFSHNLTYDGRMGITFGVPK